MTKFEMFEYESVNYLKSSTNKNNSYFHRRSFKSNQSVFNSFEYYSNKFTNWSYYINKYSTKNPIMIEIINKSGVEGKYVGFNDL